MTLNECYQKYHNMIVWVGAMTVAEFPEQSLNDLVHAAYLHIARYIDTSLDERYKDSTIVYNLARWGMLKEALREANYKKRHQVKSDYSRYDAVPRSRNIPPAERINRSRVCSSSPYHSILADEIVESLCHEERMLLLGMSVYGITAQEIAEENDTDNVEVLAAYHDVIKKVRLRLSKPTIKRRKSRASWHKWFCPKDSARGSVIGGEIESSTISAAATENYHCNSTAVSRSNGTARGPDRQH